MTRATGLPEPAHKSRLCSPKSTLVRSLVKSRSFFDARIHDERSAPGHISCFRSQEKPQFTLASHRSGTKSGGTEDKGVIFTLMSVWRPPPSYERWRNTWKKSSPVIALKYGTCKIRGVYRITHSFPYTSTFLFFQTSSLTPTIFHDALELERTEAFNLRHNSTCSYLPPKCLQIKVSHIRLITKATRRASVRSNASVCIAHLGPPARTHVQ